jgi:hypothetical protein
MNDPPYSRSVKVGSLDDVARAEVVDLAKFSNPPRAGAAGAMNDMSDARHSLAQAFGLGNGAMPHLDFRQVVLKETLIAGWPKQDDGRNRPGAERV